MWPHQTAPRARPRDAEPTLVGRGGKALLDLGIVVALILALPFVIIVAGAPLALALKLLLWLAGGR